MDDWTTNDQLTESEIRNQMAAEDWRRIYMQEDIHHVRMYRISPGQWNAECGTCGILACLEPPVEARATCIGHSSREHFGYTRIIWPDPESYREDLNSRIDSPCLDAHRAACACTWEGCDKTSHGWHECIKKEEHNSRHVCGDCGATCFNLSDGSNTCLISWGGICDNIDQKIHHCEREDAPHDRHICKCGVSVG